MTATQSQYSDQLKGVCKLVGARWASWVRRDGAVWSFGPQYGLARARQEALTRLLDDPEASAWLGGAVHSGRARIRRVPEGMVGRVGGARLYAFPNESDRSLLLACGEDLDRDQQTVLRLLAAVAPTAAAWAAALGQPTPSAPNGLPARNVVTATEAVAELTPPHPIQPKGTGFDFPFNSGPEAPYDPESVLHWVLDRLCGLVVCQAAYLATRSGDYFRVAAAWNYAEGVRSQEITIGQDPALMKLVLNRTALRQEFQGGPYPEYVLAQALEQAPRAVLGLPLQVGRRLIGLAVLVSNQAQAFSPQEQEQAQAALDRVAHAIENALAFTDLARYLQQAALLNELATSASTGAHLEEVSRRVTMRLQRSFRTEQAAVLLLSEDGRWLQEYGSETEGEAVRLPVEGSLAGQVVQQGAALRRNTLKPGEKGLMQDHTSHSALAVPLIYRGRPLGCLVVESRAPGYFNSQDEQLLTVVASHLAVLFENVRLRQEAREHANNLSLIHKVVQRVVGLTDTETIAQTVAGLMAQYFGYEYSVVLLPDESGQNLVHAGVGGSKASQMAPIPSFPITQGISGKVFRSGVSYFCNDVSLNPDYLSFPGWRAGSEMCVPLRIGDTVLGLLNLEREALDAFSENDLILLESLAGVLASVLSNAQRYQDLQDTIHYLEVARKTALDLSSDLELEPLIERILERALELVRARGVILGLKNPLRPVMDVVSSIYPWDHFNLSEIPVDNGLTGWIYQTGEPFKVPDYNAWEGRMIGDGQAPFGAVAGVPLKMKGEVIGVLMVMDDHEGRQFSDDDLRLLELLAPQVAVSIRNARLYLELGERIQAQELAEERMLHSARLAALGELAAGVAHELNNPLTTVSGFVELALEELPSDLPQRGELELVMSEARRARGVVRRLLDFSRQSEYVRMETNLNGLVMEVIALMRHTLATQKVAVDAVLADDLPLLVLDPNQIKQVLLNLIQNAMQAMPEGGALVVRTAKKKWKGQEGVSFAVQDSGEGISADHLDRIFEPFFTTRPVGKGTGLGLSVSYGLIADHGGHIQVESQLGEGSCFTVWLPIEKGGES